MASRRRPDAATRLSLLPAAVALLALAACGPAALTGGQVSAPPGAIGPRMAPASEPQGTSQTLSLSGTVPPQVTAMAPRARPRVAEATGSGAEREFATAILRDLQPISFRENREYCGYIGRDRAGRLMRTPLSAGVEAGCALPLIPPGMTVLASFHTHSTYSPLYASEFPTSQDMRSDAALGVDGYISTPGGRLWFVDTDTMTVRQLCGRGCLPQDPNYRPDDDGPLRPVFGFEDLIRFENGLL